MNYDNIIIRPAAADDAGVILRLLCEISKLHYEGRPDIFSGQEPKYDIESVRELIKSDFTVLVADICGAVAGYLIAKTVITEGKPHLRKRRVLYVDDLCVDVEYRGHGAGKALMLAARDKALALDCDEMELNVWSFNKSAIEFYSDFGMTPQRMFMELKLK